MGGGCHHNDHRRADIVAQAFHDSGIPGVIEDPDDIRLAQQDDRTWDYIDNSLLDDMGEEVLVKAYLSSDASFDDKLALIKERLNWLRQQELGLSLGSLHLALNNVKEEDWANNWKQYYKPVKVSRRMVIKPSWEQYIRAPDEIVLEMEPGMAFGTGTHETTALCIEALDKYVKSGDIVISAAARHPCSPLLGL